MVNVRMGEMAVSNRPGDVLVAIGLGSCIGLAIADREAGIAGLAHIVLPEALGKDGPTAKFAELAVPDLIAKLEQAGAVRRRMQAVLIGGARMFTLGASLDIGSRNAEAVRQALRESGIRIHCESVGGSRGRTARIVVGEDISSQLAGGARSSLLPLGRGATATRGIDRRAQFETVSGAQL